VSECGSAFYLRGRSAGVSRRSMHIDHSRTQNDRRQRMRQERSSTSGLSSLRWTSPKRRQSLPLIAALVRVQKLRDSLELGGLLERPPEPGRRGRAQMANTPSAWSSGCGASPMCVTAGCTRTPRVRLVCASQQLHGATCVAQATAKVWLMRRQRPVNDPTFPASVFETSIPDDSASLNHLCANCAELP
jgi:hypothetical protein